jgi:hypothetical protein
VASIVRCKPGEGCGRRTFGDRSNRKNPDRTDSKRSFFIGDLRRLTVPEVPQCFAVAFRT